MQGQAYLRHGGRRSCAVRGHNGVVVRKPIRDRAEVRAQLGGICIYPIIGMFDWHRPRPWMPMGLWDCDSERGMRRLVHRPMLDALAGSPQPEPDGSTHADPA